MKSKYFRISVTKRCNLSCPYCHREGNFSAATDELTPQEIQTACEAALDAGFTKFKLTGGEPTCRKDFGEIVSRLSKLPLPDLSMITNGTLLEDCARDLWNCGLRRLNVSLNTLNPKKFRTLQRRANFSVEKILRGLNEAQLVGFKHIKLNFVFVNEESRNDLTDLLNFINGKDFTLVLLPVIERNSNYTLKELHELLTTYGITGEETITDNEGIKKRLIRLTTNAKVLLREDELAQKKPYAFCDACKMSAHCREGIFPIRLSADGKIIPCLANSEHRISIRRQLAAQDMSALKSVFRKIEGWYNR